VRRTAQKREHDRRRRGAGNVRHDNTAEWKRLRELQLQTEPLCRRCLQRERRVQATIADHIRPHRGNPVLFFDPRNLQSLCKPCHDGSKQSEERRGYIKGTDRHGRPLDPRHPWHTEATKTK
jgi:5-methylcytosine-specific restriction enzyme A